MNKGIFVLGAILLFLSGQLLHSQTTISGVINDYARVLEFDQCGTSAVVNEDLDDQQDMDLAVGDRVLIIQMTGALYSNGDDKNFGTVEDYSSCGLFEFVTVESVAADAPYWRVTFENPILNAYQASPGVVQLVKVPQYVDVTVTGDLTAQIWDGETGGVLVFEATGTLVLNDDIHVNGKGFAGGTASTDGGAADTSLYGYTYANNSGKSGLRGGGIGVAPTNGAGRGPLVNGGGGGNGQNAGGGGGGNAGAGGRGGNQTFFSNDATIRRVGGLAGKGLDYSSVPVRRIFMGGGGGGGHQNDDNDAGVTYAGPGGRGGGIVIIRAAQIDGNGYTISANGSQGNTGSGDGGGGGGAGGVVLLSIPSYDDDATGSPDLNIEAEGGYGGIVWGCHGAGGGGGGGVIGLSLSTQSAGPVTSRSVAGGGCLGVASCSPTEPEHNGATIGYNGLQLFTITLPGDPLP